MSDVSVALRHRRPKTWTKVSTAALTSLSILCSHSCLWAHDSNQRSPLLKEVAWPKDARRVNWVDYSLLGLGATTAMLSRALGPRAGGPSGGILFDDAVRTGLRSETAQGRLAAGTASDVLLITAASYGQIIDPLLHVWVLRQNPDVASQLFWMNSEVIALTFGVQQLTSNLVGRERPFGGDCDLSDLTEEEQAECANDDRYRSFFSGHTSVPFSIAAATCMHHYKVGLSRFPALTCGVGFALAGASGALRIVADKHYATDVATGLVIGTTIGALVPLWHYGFGSSKETEPQASASASRPSASITVFPQVQRHAGRQYIGLSFAGALP